MSFVIQRLKSIILFFIGIFRRALCCFRRKRHSSCESIPLTAVGVVPNYANEAEFENWNSWEDSSIKNNQYKPNSIQQQIEMYRQQTVMARQKSTDSSEENQENFFQDMAPRITRQTKVFLNHNENNDNGRNLTTRLNVNPEGLVANEGELGEWDEGTGWEEQTQTDWNTQNILREKRKQERERRLWEQQQKKQEKYMKPLGAKIS